MNPKNTPIHGMLGGVVQRAPASPMPDKTQIDSAMDFFRRTGKARPISGGADEDQHYDLLPEEIRGELGDVTTLSDERMNELEGTLEEMARAPDTDLPAVEQAVEAVTALRVERAAREDAALEAEEKRTNLLAQLDPEADPEADPDATPADPAADPEATPADPDADPDATPAPEADPDPAADPEADPDAAANEPQAVAAGAGRTPAPVRANARARTAPRPGAMGARRPASQGAQGLGTARSRLVDSRGQELADFNAAAQAIIDMQDAIGHGGGGDGDFIRTGRLQATYPRELTISDPTNGEANQAIIASVASPEAIVAAGGFCAPTAVEYDLTNISDSSRPVRDSLAQVAAPRGGVRFARPVNFDALAGAVRIWTEQDDIDALTDSSVRKPCIRVDCNDFEEVKVRAIPWCLTFGNLGARAWPEQVADALRSVLAMHARVAEAEALKDIADAGQDVDATRNMSATRDILDALDRAVARYRYHFRTARNFPLRAILPDWLRAVIRSDLAREIPGSTDERLAVADAQIDTFFAARAVNTSWRMDEAAGTTAGTDFYGAQGDGALIAYPDEVRINLFHEGAFGFLSTPEIDFGVVRDSTLNARNDYTIMAETFEGVIFRGLQSLNVDVALCPSGATSATVEYDCPVGS